VRIAAAVLVLALAAPALTRADCAPSSRSILPASGIVGTQVAAVVEGEALAGVSVTVLGDAGLGVAVTSTSDLAANLQLTIDAAAVPGERILVLETPAGSTAVSFTVNAAGGPIVASLSPPLIATLGLPLDVTIGGANLGGITPASVAVSGTGVTVTGATPAVDGTSLALSFAVDAAADLGTHAVTISNGVGSVVLLLYVQRPAPTVTGVSPAAGEVGAAVPFVITGTNLSGAAVVISIPPGSDATEVVISDVATPNDTTVTGLLTIAPTTAPSAEARLLIVTTESGQSTIEFFIVPPGTPTVTAVLPGAGERGETVPVTLKGLNLTGATISEAVPSADVDLTNPVVVDDETITLDISVDPMATLGVDHTLVVSPGGGTAIFRVIPTGTPFFNAARPPFGNRGAVVSVRLDGVNLTGVVPNTGVELNPSGGIVITNPLTLDDRLAQATFDVDPMANIGASRDVIITTGGGSFTRPEAFRVNIPGQIPTITDVTPTLVEPGTTTPMTVTGSNFEGGAVLVTGPGATVSNVVVDPSGTLITFDLTLAVDAPAETRAVIVVTASGTARCNIASNPPAPPLVAAKLVKTGALFTVASTAFRLFVFEFSINDLFATGLRTVGIPSPTGSLTLDRQDTAAIEQAFRDAHRGYVRVRAVTATNRVAVSPGQSIRR
jgi:hypothetical protein